MSKSFIGLVRKFLKSTKLIPLINYLKNRLRFKAVVHPHKVIWIDPKTIKYRYKGGVDSRKKHGAGSVLDGDWDLDVEIINPEKTLKYKGAVAHFKHGVPWEETDLFKDHFAKRMKRGDLIRGRRSIRELLDYYNDKIDGLYESMEKDGVLLPSEDHSEIDPMYVCIGREGKLIYTDSGTHRLFIAIYLNLRRIPVVVWWRHKKWQEVRERLYADRSQWGKDWAKPYLNHPDLEDIFTAEK